MDIHDALSQIAQIRTTMARAELFRGYSSVAALVTAILAWIAAWLQWTIAPHPVRDANTFLAIWAGAALLGLIAAITSSVLRCRRSASELDKDKAVLALELFAPSLVAGGLLTFLMREFLWDLLWMLPGFWAILFSMGIFASRRLLPRGVSAVGGFYLVGGLVALVVCHDDPARSAPAMGVVFGAGQLAAAGMLYIMLERQHGFWIAQQ
jgi:hypothetical protein